MPRKTPAVKKKISKSTYKPKVEIDELLMNRIPSSSNTVIYDSPLYRKYFGTKSPSDMVFVFYDNNPGADPRESPRTVDGKTLEQIQAGEDFPESLEHKVVVRDHTFTTTDGVKFKKQVIAVEYEGQRYKVKHMGQNANGFPYFYIEYYKDLLYGGTENRYWGEFLDKRQQTSFGKSRKKNNMKSIASDLKYLLRIK